MGKKQGLSLFGVSRLLLFARWVRGAKHCAGVLRCGVPRLEQALLGESLATEPMRRAVKGDWVCGGSLNLFWNID